MEVSRAGMEEMTMAGAELTGTMITAEDMENMILPSTMAGFVTSDTWEEYMPMGRAPVTRAMGTAAGCTHPLWITTGKATVIEMKVE
jgi:hypothetical protein